MKVRFFIRNGWSDWHCGHFMLFGFGYDYQGPKWLCWQLWLFGFCFCLFEDWDGTNKYPTMSRFRDFRMKLKYKFMRNSSCILLMFLLSGCHKIHKGVIVDKIYEEGHYYSVTVYHMVGKVSVPSTQLRYDDADYVFMVKGHKEDQEYIERFHVSSDCFERHHTGDFYNDEIEPETDDN